MMNILKPFTMPTGLRSALTTALLGGAALCGLASAQVTVTISDATQSDCDASPPQFTVTVVADNLSGADAFGLDIDFDLNAVSFVSAAKGAGIQDWGIFGANVNNNGTPGNPNDDFLRIGGVPLFGAPVSGTVELATLTFNCVPGACPVISELTPFNPTDDIAGATLVPGSSQCGQFPEIIFQDASAGCPSGQLAVSVLASELTGADAYGLDIFFDLDALSFVSATKGAAFADWGIFGANVNNNGTPGDPTDDFLRVGAVPLFGTPITGTNVELFTITFNCATCPNTSTITGANFTDDIAGYVSNDGTLECIDNQAPTAVCVGDLTVNLSDGVITPAQLDGGSTDPDGDTLTLTVNGGANFPISCANVGAAFTLTLGVSDGSLSDSCDVQVTVVDDVDPTVVTNNISVNLTAGGTVNLTQGNFDALGAGSSDTCGTVTISAAPASFSCANRGNNSVVVTVTDEAGNTASANATVEVLDVTPPTVVTQNITVQIGAGGTVSITPAQINNGSTDACGTPTAVSVTPNTFDCGDLGANQVTLTVQDTSGLTATGTATVTVQDVTAPVITAQSFVATLDSYGNASITAEDVVASATDNCDSTVTIDLSVTEFTCDDLGTNEVEITGTDDSGNEGTATASVVVVDEIAPILDVVTEPITLSLGADGTATLIAASAVVYTNDNCALDPAGATANQTTFTCANIGANTVTISIADTSGNVSTGDVTVNVVDEIAPTAVANDITVELNENGEATIAPSDVDGGSSDNCELNLSLDISTFTCADTAAPVTVTLTATDGGGLTSSDTAVVTVLDTLDPVIDAPVTFELALDATGNAVLAAEDLYNTVTDNCGVASVTIDNDTFDCGDAGTSVNVVITATDTSGNIETATVSVSITDPNGVCAEGTPEEGEGDDPCSDFDDNGIVDDPLACLEDGIVFGSTNVGVLGGCLLETRQLLFTNSGGGNVSVTVPDPNNFEVTVVISVPSSVIPEGSSAILVGKVSCDLENLLSGDDSADVLGANLDRDNVPVEEFIPGTYVLATVFTQDGDSFTEVTNVPATITYQGLDVNTVEDPAVFQHGTIIEEGADGPLANGDAAGAWAETTSSLDGTNVVVTTTGLSVFVVTQPAPQVPFLSVTPNSNYARIVGVVGVGGARQIEFTVQNTGPGVVTGAATITGAQFSILGDATYTLVGSTTDTVRVQFAPTAEGSFPGSITFTGGTNGPITVNLWGVGSAATKTAFFGCGATDGTGSGFGDIALLGGLLAALLVATRFWTRARQS